MKKSRNLFDLWRTKEKSKAPAADADSSRDESPPSTATPDSLLIIDSAETTPRNSTSSTSQTSSTNSESSHVTVFNDNKPHRPVLEFPFRTFDKQQRCSGKNWYTDHKWLEYNENEDKCYCFPCRVFLNKTVPFNKNGYSNWKNATGILGGLNSHANNPRHIDAMKLWCDCDNRDQSASTIVHKISNNSEHRQWLETIFLLIKALVKNGLPLRGHTECTDFEEGVSGGLYLDLLDDVIFKFRPDLLAIAKKLPKNAKYTSPTIQNEVISVMRDLVERRISKQIEEGGLYTLMVDGTTDKSNVEIVSMVCRYIVEDDEGIQVVEHVVHMESSDDRSAKALCELVTRSLKDVNISLDGLVSQCYDGASVMSGELGGLQTLLSEYCNRFIVYIHCFCHRLHLTVECIFENIEEVSQYFTTVSSLHAFFKKKCIRALYDGSKLKRLLTTRWSGHRDATLQLKENYKNVVDCLQIARTPTKAMKMDPTDVALATGLLTLISDDEWIFLTFILNEILELVDIGNKILQSRGKQNVLAAVSVIESVRDKVKFLPTRYPNEEAIRDDVNQSMDVKLRTETKIAGRKRRKSVPSHLVDDFFVTDRLPSARTETGRFKPILVEMVDRLTVELDNRFQDQNTHLWASMEALLPSSPNVLDASVLSKLFEYAMTVPLISRKLSGKNLKNLCRVSGLPASPIGN